MAIRIVVAIDVEHTNDPEEAYSWLYRRLCSHEDMPWESTAEWYDDNGERIPNAVLQACYDAAESLELEPSALSGRISIMRRLLSKKAGLRKLLKSSKRKKATTIRIK